MSLFNVMDVAGSALAAQSLRLNTTASNMANANSAASSLEETYRARHPVFETALGAALDGEAAFEPPAGVGVEVSGIVESQAPLRREYQPGHPLADESGYVFLPNVNVVEEMANMIEASRSYQTNVEIMEASKQMLTRTLALGQQ
jgi:flagellar basal-body rod protein FlgC